MYDFPKISKTLLFLLNYSNQHIHIPIGIGRGFGRQSVPPFGGESLRQKQGFSNSDSTMCVLDCKVIIIKMEKCQLPASDHPRYAAYKRDSSAWLQDRSSPTRGRQSTRQSRPGYGDFIRTQFTFDRVTFTSQHRIETYYDAPFF